MPYSQTNVRYRRDPRRTEDRGRHFWPINPSRSYFAATQHPHPPDHSASGLIRKVGRVAVAALLKIGHTATARFGPHPRPESRRHPMINPFSNGKSEEHTSELQSLMRIPYT